jgi:drug/metabolite transporter (DMT)-like permease
VRPQDWATVFLLALLFGSSFCFTEIANDDAGPLTIAAGRLLIGGALLAVIVRATGKVDDLRPLLGPLVVLGVFNSFVPISLIAWAQQGLPSGVTAILAATAPIFGIFFAHFALPGEGLTAGRLGGTFLAFIGVVLIIAPWRAADLQIASTAPFAVLTAAASSAAAGVFGRKVMVTGTSPLMAACGQVIVAAILATALALIIERPLSRPLPEWPASTALFAMGTLSTALAYFLFFRLLSRVGAANTLLVGFLVPVSATVLGVIFLGESLDLIEIAGLSLVMLSLLIVNRRIKRRWKPHT